MNDDKLKILAIDDQQDYLDVLKEVMMRLLPGAAIPAGNPKAGDVEEIIKAGERAAALTRQLLTFSRKQVVQFKVLDLDRIVPEMVRMLRRMIPEDIEFKTFLNAAPAAVLANQGQLEQVILNLAPKSSRNTYSLFEALFIIPVKTFLERGES